LRVQHLVGWDDPGCSGDGADMGSGGALGSICRGGIFQAGGVWLMPRSTLRPCTYPGCTALVRSGRCESHQDVSTSEDRKARQRLYGRAAWQRMRVAQLARQPWCEDCLRANIYTPATDVHHRERHQGNVAVFGASELESLCHSCHSKRTAIESRDAINNVLPFGVSERRGHPHEKKSPIEAIN